MRIVLVNPASPFLIRQDVMPPLGLWYIAKILKDAGHSVELVEMGLGDEIPKGADVYGVTGTSAQVRQIEYVAYLLFEEEGFKVIGGPHATLFPLEMLHLGFNAVVRHEGEPVVRDVMEWQKCGVFTTKRIKDIDDLMPDRSQAHRYHYEINGIPATTMMTSRGCPYNCAFCSKDVWGRRYVPRSVESVGREVAEVCEDYQAIMFYDDTFMIGRRRLEGLCEMLAQYGITWRAFARSDESDVEVLQMMKDAGCAEIGVGIETGSEKILANINKRETLDDHRRCVAAAHEVGLRVKGFVIVGLPGESWQTVNETDQFLAEIQLDDVDISILSVYAGCDIYKHPEKYDIWFDEDQRFYKGKPGEYQCRVRTSHMSSTEIIKARELLHRHHKKG